MVLIISSFLAIANCTTEAEITIDVRFFCFLPVEYPEVLACICEGVRNLN